MVILKVTGGPEQPFKDGVAVTTPTLGVAEPLLLPVKAAIFPEPLAARPIPEFVLVQLTVALEGITVNDIAGTCCWSHLLMFGIMSSNGVGLTITVFVPTDGQPPEDVTVNVTIYDPGLPYICEGDTAVDVLPSPKFQL
jgi:hypothetical protein